MGTPIPIPIVIDPVPPGAGCPFCWGAGKPFGDVDTPESVIVTISGVNKGPNWTPANEDPLEGMFELNQEIAEPCIFSAIIGDLIFDLFWDTDPATFGVQRFGDEDPFFGVGVTLCVLRFENTQQFFFVGGSAVISLPETT